MEADTWVALPFAGQPLESVVHFGNGKDADLEIKFADGRRAKVGAWRVRVDVEGSVAIEATPWDDVSLRIEYHAPTLYFHSGQIGVSSYDENDEVLASFVEEV